LNVFQEERMEQEQPAGYFAAPATGDGRGVLVLHAWWGLNDNIKRLTDKLASTGFVAFAPDLFEGKVADTPEEAQLLATEFDGEQTVRAVEAAADWLQNRAGGHGIAVVGFSFGASYALTLASARPDFVRSVVLFYGTGDVDLSTARAAYQGHFAENDPYEPSEYVDALEQALRNRGLTVEFHRYAGVGHWFFEPDRPDAYDAGAATLAWERTLEFLNRPAV
jgi:carboxymethylenebutenolidase